jgi:hypothetical protein
MSHTRVDNQYALMLTPDTSCRTKRGISFVFARIQSKICRGRTCVVCICVGECDCVCMILCVCDYDCVYWGLACILYGGVLVGVTEPLIGLYEGTSTEADIARSTCWCFALFSRSFTKNDA